MRADNRPTALSAGKPFIGDDRAHTAQEMSEAHN